MHRERRIVGQGRDEETRETMYTVRAEGKDLDERKEERKH